MASPMSLIVLVIFVIGVNCQRSGTEVPVEVDFDLPRPISASINDLIQPWYSCHVETTKEILGYDLHSYRPVYARKCSGYCLSLIKAPNTCQPSYQYISVVSNPYFAVGFAKSVRQVSACNCKPKQCQVIDNNAVVHWYNHGSTVIDNCNRKCSCSYGTLLNCCRQRKEFRTMPTSERQRYIETYKFVSQTLPYKTSFDALVTSHQTLFSSGIHGSSAFFPWHRYFILKLENLLQQVDCRVTVPYWDWALQAANPLGSVIWGSGASYLGGDGSGSGNCVTTGPFAWPGWAMANGNCLSRNFQAAATTATKPMIASYIAANPLAANYNTFRSTIEGGVGTHNHVHCIIDGTMCLSSSAQTPEFFLHHGFIDKIWHDWQMVDPTHVTAYSGANNVPMPGTATRPVDMFDLTAQVMEGTEAPVRVCYNEPVNFGFVDILVANIGIEALNLLPRVRMDPTNPNLFKMMNWDEQRIAALRAEEAAANDPERWTIVEQADAIGNCTLLSSLGVFIPDDVLNRGLSELVENGVEGEEPSTC